MAIRDTSLGLLTALVAAVLLPAAPAARAQVITNTASAEWTHDGHRGEALSNRVDVTVVPRPPEPPSIATYRLTSGTDRSPPPLVRR